MDYPDTNMPAVIASANAGVQFRSAAAVRGASDQQKERDKVILEHIETVAKVANGVSWLMRQLRPKSDFTYLALQDGLGRLRVVELESRQLPPLVELLKVCGRTPRIGLKGMQLVSLALDFSDPDVVNGVRALIQMWREPEIPANQEAPQLRRLNREMDEQFAPPRSTR